MKLFKRKYKEVKCKHKNVVEIGFIGDLPLMTGANNNFWDGF